MANTRRTMTPVGVDLDGFNMGDTVKQQISSDQNQDASLGKQHVSKGKKKSADQWNRFLNLAQEQKDKRGEGVDKGVQIYLDSDIMKTLEKLRISGLNGTKYPVRYLLNAAVRAFLETNADKIEEQLSKA